MEQLLQHLLAGAQTRNPAPAVATGSSDIEILLRNLLPGNMALATRSRPGPMRRDWATVWCFSCGKAGHSATFMFPADPAGAVTVGVASLADAGLVTVGVTDLADAGAAPLADAGMAFPADLAGVVTICM